MQLLGLYTLLIWFFDFVLFCTIIANNFVPFSCIFFGTKKCCQYLHDFCFDFCHGLCNTLRHFFDSCIWD
jgi:hypothetical protein